MKQLGSQHARSVGLITVSQTFSALSNFLIVMALGRYGGIRMVGEYSLAFVTYTAFLGVQRAAVTNPLMARALGSTGPAAEEASLAVMSSLCLGLGTSVVLVVVGSGLGIAPLAMLGLVLPGVLVEDALRFVAFRSGRHVVAVVIDGLWVVGSAGSVLVLRAHAGSARAVLLWGLAGSLAAVVGMVYLRVRPRPLPAACRWWRAYLWRSGRWLILDAFLYNVDIQVQAFGFTAAAGIEAFGRLQVAQSLVGVAAFVTTGVNVVALSYLARNHERRERTAVMVSVIDLITVLVLTGGIVVALHPILHVLYGHRIVLGAPIVLAAGLYMGLLVAGSGPQALLMARHSEQALPATRTLLTAFFTPLAVATSVVGFQDALWVLCAGAAMYVVVISYVVYRPAPAMPEDPYLPALLRLRAATVAAASEARRPLSLVGER